MSVTTVLSDMDTAATALRSSLDQSFRAQCGASGCPARWESWELRFLIYQRQSLQDGLSYSCGIVYLPPGGPRLTLARYNGPSHQHGEIRYKPHIHHATETAILAGRKPEHAAEETTRYESLEGALACLIEDFRLSGIRANPDHPSLFNGI